MHRLYLFFIFTKRKVRKVVELSDEEAIQKITALTMLEMYFSELEKHDVKCKTTESKQEIMENVFGFSITCSPSNVAGTGVFVSSGRIKKGSLVSMYPGMKYISFIQEKKTQIFCAQTIIEKKL